jgi:inner membrane transporter RhtA
LSVQVGASFAKGLFPTVGAIGATMLRLLFASTILLIIWRPYRIRFSKRGALFVSLYGIALGVMNLVFYLALERIHLGIAVALEFVGPLSLSLLHSKRPLDMVWALLAALGIYLIVPDMSAVQSADPIGIVLALAAGACWAGYIFFGKKASREIESGHVVALGMTIAMLVVVPFALAFAGERLLNPAVYPLALGVAILSSALPYSLEMIALRRMPIKTFGIWMSLEPAVAALCGIVILAETLSLLQWVAIACIMLASAGSHLRSTD